MYLIEPYIEFIEFTLTNHVHLSIRTRNWIPLELASNHDRQPPSTPKDERFHCLCYDARGI
jgi:hypothetical protein